MRTLRDAAALLSGATTSRHLDPIARALGFGEIAAALDRDARVTLGIPPAVSDARIAAGPGALRALLVTAPAATPTRDLIGQLAARLARQSPHLFFLILVVSTDGNHVAVAAWSSDRRIPRVAALLVDRRRVLDSDADTLRALGTCTGQSDVLTHARWCELLGRDALSRRFYAALEGAVETLAASLHEVRNDADRREAALLCVSRLLFLSFLEAKGWLDGDRGFLTRRFDACVATGGAYHRRVLLPLMFGTLNTPYSARSAAARGFGAVPFLNGGLFARAAVERRIGSSRFSDEALGVLHGDVLSRYRFTAREDSTSWSEAAVDPEMLGRAFESLMASPDRQAGGVYYTPQALVSDITAGALADALSGPSIPRGVAEMLVADGPGVGAQIGSAMAARVRARLSDLRVLDPACGSGAFLVHALERIAALHEVLGDARPVGMIRRDVLTHSIFGVDVNPTAVWLCELRLWLSVVIDAPDDNPRRVPPLPNLDHHVRVGDSLAGGAFDATPRAGSASIARLRERYVRATGARKQHLARALDRAERAVAIAVIDGARARTAAQRRSLLAALRGRDLFGERITPSPALREEVIALRDRARRERATRRALASGGALPFSFAAQFADAAAAGGFDVLIGNPPWVRVHRIPPATREALHREFRVYRNAGWATGASTAGASTGFAGQVDLSAMFVERSLSLLRDGGTLALLLPAKLWRSLAGGGVRDLLLREANVTALDDWSESRSVFDAAVYPSSLLARRIVSSGASEAGTPSVRVGVHHRDRALRWQIPLSALPFDASAGSPWILSPPDVRRAFDRLIAAGVPLAESSLGRPQLGVKCGCNDAFVVRADAEAVAGARATGDAISVTTARGRTEIDAALLRPLLRGESVAAWHALPTSEWLIWTHGDDGAPLDRLPAHTDRWMRTWRRRLEARTDGRGRARWWSLFRTDAADANRARVVWCDIGRTPRALVLERRDPTVPLNSCYVVRCADHTDALTLVALLNSPVAAAWLGLLAEPARGGYRRFFAWTLSLLPLPRDWEVARSLLAPLATRATAGEQISAHELACAAVRAYHVRPDSIAPLLEWQARS